MPTISHRLAAVRAADLLVLHIDLYNLEPGGIGLRRKDPAAPSHVVLRFPSQHLLEEAFAERDDDDDGGAPLLAQLTAAGGATVALAAGLGAAPSRVAFTVPDEFEEIPASLEALLEFLAKCRLNVVGTAEVQPAPPGLLLWLKSLLFGGGGPRAAGEGEEKGRGPSLVEPGLDQTAIELPYRLVLSPRSHAGFSHAATPPALPGLDRVELWHSRLGLAPGKEGKPRDHAERTVRAVWVRRAECRPRWDPANARARPLPPPAPPFLAAMTEDDRHQIAHLTSNYWQGFETAPVEVERLALSALGGWLDATGRWEPPEGLSLEEWTNRTTLGRDHFVKLVHRGYLFPFGHRASLIQIAERKWQEAVPGRPAALRKRLYVMVRVPELRFDAGAGHRLARQMPLTRVRLRTLVTPAIEPPADPRLFRVIVRGQPFRFAIEGEDERKSVTQFSMPLVFVEPPERGAIDVAAAGTALRGVDEAHRTDLGGTPVALVPERPKERGATTFPVSSAAFEGDAAPGFEAGFHPKLVDADIALPAVEIVSGKGAAQRFKYAETYLEHGFDLDGNKGEVFAELAKPVQLDLRGAADKAGGLLSPSMAINGLSRAVGPLGGNDLTGLSAGKFDPKEFFAGALGGAKLFGLFNLHEVIEEATGPLDKVGAAPQLITKRAQDTLVAEWTYAPKLQPYPAAPDSFFVPRPGAGSLTLYARVETKGQQPRAEVECTLAKVDIHLPPGEDSCIVIPIEEIRFRAVVGKKLDVNVELGEIEFGGPLEFVNELRELIPADGFSDPPALEVTPERISSGFSIALPDVAIGVFALQHVSLGARFELPFLGPPPTFAFNFCTRNEPFLLTVSAFGGGGFFLIKVDPKGMQRLEASFEFGASVSMNFGVASGGVHVMAGIYFTLGTDDGAILTGYFRAGGNVSVLGIVSISIELYLGLSYEIESGKAIGRASLTVEIELCLFSTSVQIACERKLAGSSGDPPLADLLSPYDDPDDRNDPPRKIDPWADYCTAYA